MKKTRWQQRFENFERAFLLLRSAFEAKPSKDFSDLEKEGIIQRFEYTFELAWKTLKDYLEYSGIKLEQVTLRYVIKQAFSAKIIKDGQAWIDMLEQRNLLSHTYDQAIFEKAVKTIAVDYIPLIEQLFSLLKEKDNNA